MGSENRTQPQSAGEPSTEDANVSAVNMSSMPGLLPADPNMDDNTTAVAIRGKRLRQYLHGHAEALDQLTEVVENAESLEERAAVKQVARTMVLGLLNRANDLLEICVADDAPMNLPFNEYIEVMTEVLQKMLTVVQAAKKNDMKL